MAVKKETGPATGGPEIGHSFSKEQLLAAEQFQGRRDILNALLSTDKQYTVATTEKMINDYMKGQVE